jgi:hypothetical protein
LNAGRNGLARGHTGAIERAPMQLVAFLDLLQARLSHELPALFNGVLAVTDVASRAAIRE